MAKKQQPGGSAQHPDLLAAVLLHTLVSNAREGMTLSCLVAACERDPGDVTAVEEIEIALRVLLEDGLAQRDDGLAQRDDGLFRPTRAAIRASELSF